MSMNIISHFIYYCNKIYNISVKESLFLFPQAMSQVPRLQRKASPFGHEHLANAARDAKRRQKLASLLRCKLDVRQLAACILLPIIFPPICYCLKEKKAETKCKSLP